MLVEKAEQLGITNECYCQVVVLQGFNPSTDEAELTFLVYRFPGQARLHIERTYLQKSDGDDQGQSATLHFLI